MEVCKSLNNTQAYLLSQALDTEVKTGSAIAILEKGQKIPDGWTLLTTVENSSDKFNSAIEAMRKDGSFKETTEQEFQAFCKSFAGTSSPQSQQHTTSSGIAVLSKDKQAQSTQDQTNDTSLRSDRENHAKSGPQSTTNASEFNAGKYSVRTAYDDNNFVKSEVSKCIEATNVLATIAVNTYGKVNSANCCIIELNNDNDYGINIVFHNGGTKTDLGRVTSNAELAGILKELPEHLRQENFSSISKSKAQTKVNEACEVHNKDATASGILHCKFHKEHRLNSNKNCPRTDVYPNINKKGEWIVQYTDKEVTCRFAAKDIPTLKKSLNEIERYAKGKNDMLNKQKTKSSQFLSPENSSSLSGNNGKARVSSIVRQNQELFSQKGMSLKIFTGEPTRNALNGANVLVYKNPNFLSGKYMIRENLPNGDHITYTVRSPYELEIRLREIAEPAVIAA